MIQCSLTSFKTFYRSLEKPNQRHFISSSEVRSTSLPSNISLKKFFHQVALELSKKPHQASIRWFRGYGTYLWLSGSSLKKDCMAAIIPFSVPRSVTRSTEHPQYSPTASRKWAATLFGWLLDRVTYNHMIFLLLQP